MNIILVFILLELLELHSMKQRMTLRIQMIKNIVIRRAQQIEEHDQRLNFDQKNQNPKKILKEKTFTKPRNRHRPPLNK